MAISNPSSKQKTLKSMFTLLDSDNYTIDQTLYYCKYNIQDIVLPYKVLLDDYRDYFEQYLITMEVPEKFYYQPAAFAENYYGIAELDWLVLYFAKINTLFEFDKDKIKVLPKTMLNQVNKLLVEKRNEINNSFNEPIHFKRELL